MTEEQLKRIWDYLFHIDIEYRQLEKAVAGQEIDQKQALLYMKTTAKDMVRYLQRIEKGLE